ncbi:hypothetical protein H4R34_003723 [Dimargaris verticillata]|uniref:Uncharacterized protein n=1 Tax=Dimargaris verticillata TaxID=2761393 RepID=A0A9W8B0A6_9FUNG|nr:hypothetical protein H4R34_003723 [Dimargaris verticillata]
MQWAWKYMVVCLLAGHAATAVPHSLAKRQVQASSPPSNIDPELMRAMEAFVDVEPGTILPGFNFYTSGRPHELLRRSVNKAYYDRNYINGLQTHFPMPDSSHSLYLDSAMSPGAFVQHQQTSNY